jgi:hypothetical protein
MTAVTKLRTDETALRKARMLIGGKWVECASDEWLEVEDPAHRRPIAEVPRGRAEDVARAVKFAAGAFPAWSRMVPRERGRLLARIADALEVRVEELARTIAVETGNALRTQARPEAKTTVDILRYFGGLGGELKGETIPFGEHVLSYTRREPLGVVGAIIPWNAPVLLAALKIGPALCAGNALVLKAAEDAPLGVLMLAEVCQEFLPSGVLNVLTGLGEECGAPLANHPMVSKLSFTGSTEVGKLVMWFNQDCCCGASFVVVDTLVHNFLHRTGILDRLGAAIRMAQPATGQVAALTFLLTLPRPSMPVGLIRGFPAAILRNVVRFVPPGAPVVIGEFHPNGPCSEGPPHDYRLGPEKVQEWCKDVGLAVVRYQRQTPEHYFMVTQHDH